MEQASPRPRIRILHVQDKCGHGTSRVQGVQRLLLWWWPAFQDSEFDLSLCILRGRNEASEAFDAASMAVSYLGRSRFDPRTLFDLISLIRRERIQLLHCHGYGSTTFGRLAGALTRTPVIVHEHLVGREIPWYQRAVDRVLSPLTSRGIAVAGAVRNFMIEARAIPAAKVEVVYNGIPLEYCRSFTPTQKEALAKSLDLKLEQPIIGIIGRLHAIKGHVEFLRAAAELVRRSPTAQFLVVGDGELREALESETSNLGIDTSVHFLGHRDDISELLSILDVFVISSYSEGCPLSLLEAMAAGIPIVSTAVGGIPELVEHNETALLVPPSDPHRLAEAIRAMLEDRDLAARLAAAAKRHCESHLLIPQTVAKFGRIYHSMLAEAL